MTHTREPRGAELYFPFHVAVASFSPFLPLSHFSPSSISFDGALLRTMVLPIHSPTAQLAFRFLLLIVLVAVPEKSNAFQSAAGVGITKSRASHERPTHSSFLQKRRITARQSASSSDNDDFMSSLYSRIQKVEDKETKMPIVALDSILPRQILKIEVTNDVNFMELIKERIKQEKPYFGMVGVATLQSTGQTLPLQNGCQVEIVGNPIPMENGLRISLKAGRRFRITGEFQQEGWNEARVEFLDSKKEETTEEEGSSEEKMSLARARSRALEFTSPNMNMPDGASLVERWIELARQNERNPGQIDQLLEDIGEIPSEEEPASERAFWVGALINPLPGLGVAMEIRPQLLMARSAEERVLVALQGILASIKHMDGSAPLF